MQQDVLQQLEHRLGRVHARQRLGVEEDHEAHVFGNGLNFFHLENWYSVHSFIRTTLKLTGLYWRGLKNAQRIHVRHHWISRQDLPSLFDGFTILHISDMHVDMNRVPMRRLIELMGIRMLLNESEAIVHGDQRIFLAGIDDAHYYRVDNIEKAAAFSLLLSGHTHGGQICLPGSVPITLDSGWPRNCSKSCRSFN